MVTNMIPNNFAEVNIPRYREYYFGYKIVFQSHKNIYISRAVTREIEDIDKI